MPEPLSFQTTVSDDGHLPQTWRQAIAGKLAQFAGRSVEVVIKSPTRTAAQNRYWWGVVLPTVQRGWQQVGREFPVEVLHQHFKELFLAPEEVVMPTGEIRLRYTTTTLDKTAFYDLVEAVKWSEEVQALGVDFPDPDAYQERHGSFRSYRIAERDTTMRLVRSAA